MSALQSLVDMGATAAQARMALSRTRNDVSEAAELIFSGRLDEAEASAPGNLPTPPAAVDEDKDDSDTDLPGSDDEPADDDDDDAEMMDDDEDEDVGFYDDDDFDDGFGTNTSDIPYTQSDPYASVEFSKDRREDIIQVDEPVVQVTIEVKGRPERGTLLHSGDWMSGCPEKGEQGFLFSMYNTLASNTEPCKCPQHGCIGSWPRTKSDFFTVFSSFSVFLNHLREIVHKTCTECLKKACFACGEPLGRNDNDALFHCPTLQGVIVGCGLIMVTRLFDNLNVTHEHNNKERSPEHKKRRLLPGIDMGIPAGKTFASGTGYSGNSKEDRSGQEAALRTQLEKDKAIADLLAEIREYLPNTRRHSGMRQTDVTISPTTLAHLRRRFNSVAATLLRNDSISDMSLREELYYELMNWLEVISQHEQLGSMMAMPFMAPLSDIVIKTPTASNPTTTREIVYEGSFSPRELLEKIVIQAKSAKKGLSNSSGFVKTDVVLTEEEKRMSLTERQKEKSRDDSLRDEEFEKLRVFCNRIIQTAKNIDQSLTDTKGPAFVKKLHSTLPQLASTEESVVLTKAGDTDEERQKSYEGWSKKVCFEYADLSLPSPPIAEGAEPAPQTYIHAYNKDVISMQSIEMPKRSLAIAKELAVLTTSLPTGWHGSIFLRVDETRVDVIKALIIGPQDTPYADGCYLFDIHLPTNYNNVPPHVKTMTTKGGLYRLGPNLYADGKVCLSLLGTWSGPGWISGKSTLYQVLISIQAMILNDEPYLNEPGWANQAGTAQSKSYNLNVRRMVVNDAMLGNLKNPPVPFASVIKTHFKLKSRHISATLDKWLAEDNGASTGSKPSTLKADIAELKALLEKLDRGEDLK